MPSVCIVTGSCGLVGSEAVRLFSSLGMDVVGIDNDMRRKFFGDSGSTASKRQALEQKHKKYRHFSCDIRDTTAITDIFTQYGPDIAAVIHTAGQPSHDWAATDPTTDFTVNALGTINLLEATRRFCADASFVFTSTNKVYGDTPNRLKLVEGSSRFDCPSLPNGIDETMSVDQTKHSLFGASKLAADIAVQEYGRYFGMNTVCFRAGCITGAAHAGVPQHGFLNYLVRCAVNREVYTVIGYDGKQVRDNIHAADLVAAFGWYVDAPKPGAVYNIGGGKERSCSVAEAVAMVDRIAETLTPCIHETTPRIGDHKWWITDNRRFEADYPKWKQTKSLEQIVGEIVEMSIENCCLK